MFELLPPKHAAPRDDLPAGSNRILKSTPASAGRTAHTFVQPAGAARVRSFPRAKVPAPPPKVKALPPSRLKHNHVPRNEWNILPFQKLFRFHGHGLPISDNHNLSRIATPYIARGHD